MLIGLELLLKQTVFEEHHDGRGDSVDVAVLAHGHHTVTVHGFSGEELELLKPPEDVFHYFVHVGLEDIHLVGSGLFQFCY